MKMTLNAIRNPKLRKAVKRHLNFDNLSEEEKKFSMSPQDIIDFTESNTLIPYPAFPFVELIHKKMEVTRFKLYHVETLNMSGSTAYNLQIFDKTRQGSGYRVTNLLKANEAEKDSVYFITAVGVKLFEGDFITFLEVERMIKEGRLELKFDDNVVFERPFRLLGGVDNGYEGIREFTGEGAGAAADTNNIQKAGGMTPLKNIIKLPAGKTFNFWFKVLGDESDAVAGKLGFVFDVIKGKIPMARLN